METFAKFFARFLVFQYRCFDRIVFQGYMPLLSRPEHIVHFFPDLHLYQHGNGQHIPVGDAAISHR
jgi:hypothetical protein